MSDVVNVGSRVASIDVSPQFQPYSKVIIHVDDEHAYVAGNDSGRVLEFDNPFGTQAMANNILAKLSGYRYQPYQADGALLDPAAEIGDAINTASSYGGLYTRSRKFGRLMRADISAPHDEEINHEYQFVSPQERKFQRVTGEIRASIILTNSKIEAEVVNREAQGAELSSRITLTATQLSSEIINRQNADTEMSSRITQTANSLTSEIQNRQSADNQLSSRITQTDTKIQTEVSRATAAEGNLSTRITQTDNSISTEVRRATTAEGNLSTRITQNADGITAEVNRATRAEGNLQSSLSVQASEIAAKVSASGGNNVSGSFSWVLNASGHKWYANGSSTPVMAITASGLTVNGIINATGGKIGGFDVGSNALRYNGLNYGDTDKNYGVYVGQSGIQLGKNFKVDNGGNVRANNMTLAGTLTFLNADGTTAGTMSAANLRTGAQQAYSNYGTWNGTSTTVGNNSSYWSGGASYGYGYHNATQSGTSNYPAYFACGSLSVRSTINTSSMRFQGSSVVVRVIDGHRVLCLS